MGMGMATHRAGAGRGAPVHLLAEVRGRASFRETAGCWGGQFSSVSHAPEVKHTDAGRNSGSSSSCIHRYPPARQPIPPLEWEG